MWIFNQDGFFSVVQHRDDPEMLMIKARNRAHLERVAAWTRANFMPNLEIVELEESDYIVRANISKIRWAQYLTQRTMELDYDSVKEPIMERTDPELGHAMFDVWDRMMRYQREIHVGSASEYGFF